MNPGRLGIAGVALALAACAAPAEPPPAPPPSAHDFEGDAVCKAHNGEIRPVGVGGHVRRCVIPYRDAGKSCSNDADCEGACWITGVPEGPNSKARGTCQPSNMVFGCYAILNKGVVGHEVCYD